MKDIVDRLRTVAGREVAYAMNDAADAITALRAEVERLEGCIIPLDAFSGEVFNTLLHAGAFDAMSEDDFEQCPDGEDGTKSDMEAVGRNNMRGLNALIARATAEVERLTRERDEAQDDARAWETVAYSNGATAQSHQEARFKAEKQRDACLTSRAAYRRAIAAEVERDQLRAAQIAYASEFSFTADGDPDTGNIHANIRSLKADRDRLRVALNTLHDTGRAIHEAPGLFPSMDGDLSRCDAFWDALDAARAALEGEA